jgi:glucose/arabinose dehydrogenase
MIRLFLRYILRFTILFSPLLPMHLTIAEAGVEVKMMLSAIEMPPGFAISVYADNVPGARSMALSASGVLFVGTRQPGRVYAVLDQDRDMQADQVITLAEGLEMPNGVALWDGDLYVAEVYRVLRYPQIETQLQSPPKPEVVYDQFPKDRHHGWKFIGFGPDGRLYVSVGAPCNVCRSENGIFATIARLNRDGSGLEIYARGVRNSVGFDWHPRTGELWFTDNGRDWLGDDQPPDELNQASAKGEHFGFPFCHGGDLSDPEYGSARSCGQFTKPAVKLDAHVAPLGIRFYTGNMFPEAYHHQIFIAEHGSWNRTRKSGYRITLVKTDGRQVFGYEPFAKGWRIGNSAWGRPVDVEVMADGSLLVSDDQNGVIYRIHWAPPKSYSTPQFHKGVN